MGSGGWKPLSAHRCLISDLLAACRGIPFVTADRRMDLAEVVAAREQAAPRIAWSLLIAKAFSTVAARVPALRTSRLGLPWPRLHEHAEPVAAITVERQVAGEDVVLTHHVRSPHRQSLRELDAEFRRAMHAPVGEMASFRRWLRLARFPWPLRGWLLGLGMHARGRWRERFIGTFALSSPASSGAGLMNLISPATCSLHYGLLEADGRLEMRLTFDHRVLDGAPAARALRDLEGELRGAIRDELRSMARSAAAA